MAEHSHSQLPPYCTKPTPLEAGTKFPHSSAKLGTKFLSETMHTVSVCTETPSETRCSYLVHTQHTSVPVKYAINHKLFEMSVNTNQSQLAICVSLVI